MKIPLVKPYFDSKEFNAVKKTLESGWVAGDGPKCKELEAKFAKYVGAKHALAVGNCTEALHLALLAHGVAAGDEVIVADYSYPATSHAVAYCGATPRFADIRKDTYNIGPGAIRKLINEKTVGIMPVHTFGQAAAMDEIMEIAGEHDLFVVEDAACAAGSEYKKKKAGTWGSIGCYSMHARKNVTTGEGGMITTDDKKLADKMRALHYFGIESAFNRSKASFTVPTFTLLGYNYKLSDIAAAIGVVQLGRLESLIKQRQKLAEVYGKELTSIDGITPPFADPNARHIYQSYVCLLGKGIDRNATISALRKQGIEAQIGTYACHIQPVYNSDDCCPVSRDIYERAIALPMYYNLRPSDIAAVASALKKVLK